MKFKDLPYVKMGKYKREKMFSFNNLVEKVKKSGHLMYVFSSNVQSVYDSHPAAMASNKDIDKFKKFFKPAGEIWQIPSLCPHNINMCLAIDTSKFDFLDVVTYEELVNKINDVDGKTISQQNINYSLSDQFLVGISRQLKTIVLLSASADDGHRGRWLITDSLTADNNGVHANLNSLVCHIADRCSSNKPLFALSPSWMWWDGAPSPLMDRTSYNRTSFYETLTYGYTGIFMISAPVLATEEDVELVVPWIELSIAKDRVEEAKKKLAEKKQMLKEQEDKVEEMLVEFELSR